MSWNHFFVTNIYPRECTHSATPSDWGHSCLAKTQARIHKRRLHHAGNRYVDFDFSKLSRSDNPFYSLQETHLKSSESDGGMVLLLFCLPAVPGSIANRLGIGKHVAAATVGFFSPRVMGVGTSRFDRDVDVVVQLLIKLRLVWILPSRQVEMSTTSMCINCIGNGMGMAAIFVSEH